jgi:transcription initiation factor IIE alpha subunit
MIPTTHLPGYKLFLCHEHGFFYFSMDTDVTKNVPCPVCNEPMGFESVLP